MAAFVGHALSDDPSASPTYLTNFAGGNTYPSGWQRPMYSVIDGICIVDGRLR